MVRYFCDICGKEITDGRNYVTNVAQKTLGRVVVNISAVVDPKAPDGDQGDVLCRDCLRAVILQGTET